MHHLACNLEHGDLCSKDLNTAACLEVRAFST
jgi:hypothetical protein